VGSAYRTNNYNYSESNSRSKNKGKEQYQQGVPGELQDISVPRDFSK
jgi:hypothetical protein